MSGCCKSCKNPCMVCKRTVTTKTGLQCQGSCKSWIHFTCCSYTPGKIKDIKAKIIKVRCPCPDCATQGPKEVLMKKESSFTCINKICPVNNPPRCTKHACPINKVCQQTSTCAPEPPRCPEWPGMPCGASCKKNTGCAQDDGDRCPPRPCPPPPCQPPPYPPPPCPPPVCGMSPPCPPPVCGMSPPCPPPVCGMPPPCPPPPCGMPPPCPPPPCGMPPPCPPPPCPPPPCPPSPRPPSPCPTSPCPSTPTRSSPPATPVMPSISIVENMCETVGVLSDQLNQLMCKMTDVLAPKGQGTPCRCPQNPRR